MNSSLPEHVSRRNNLPDGIREWVAAHRRYSDLSEHRYRIAAAIKSMTWHPPVGTSLPFMPAMALMQIARDFKLDLIGGIGVSPDPLPYPEDHLLPDVNSGHTRLEDIHPGYISTYSLLGVRQLTRDGWFTTYYLDMGMAVCCVATETTNVERPPGITIKCSLNRHGECPGVARARPDGGRPEQPCGCDCGCTTRAPEPETT